MSEQDSPKRPEKPAAAPPPAGQPPIGKQPATGKPPERRPPIAQPLASHSPAGSAPSAGQPPSRRRPAGLPPAGGPAAGSTPPAGPPAAGKPRVSRPTAGSSSAGGQPPTAQKGAPAPPAVQEYLYDAFISYRHVDPDRQWAKWLHAALETYRVPQRLRQQRRLPARLKKVFRDEEELPASADLNKEIEKALVLSRFLIVICSPRTPESEWVNKEVLRFRQMKRDDKILALLIDGEPGQSFPRALREIRRKLVDSQGNAGLAVEQVEPLAADVRPSRTDESPRLLKRMAKLRMLACILGVSFDDLRRREQERFVRRAITVATGSGILVFLLTLLSFLALRERGRAEQAMLLAENQKKQVELEQARVKQQTELTKEQTELAKEKAKLAEEKEELAKQKEQEALFHDRLKRQEIYVGNMKTAWNAWQRNDLLAMAIELDKYDPRRAPEDAKLRGFEWYYLKMLPIEGCRTLDRGGMVVYDSVRFSPDNRHIATVGKSFDQHCVQIWELPGGQLQRTLKLAATTNFDSGSRRSIVGRQRVAYSPDGRLVGATCLLARVGSHEGVVKVWEAENGREVFSVTDAGIGGCSIIFSPDGEHLLAGGSHYGAIVWSVPDGKLAWVLPSWKFEYADQRIQLNENPEIFRPDPRKGGTSPVMTLFFDPSGTTLTRASGKPRVVSAWPPRPDGTSTNLKIISGSAMEKPVSPRDLVLAYGPKGPQGHWAIAQGDKAGTARLLDVSDRSRTKREPTNISVEAGPIECVALTDHHVAMARQDGMVELGATLTKSQQVEVVDRWPLRGHVGSITSLAFSADKQQLAAAGSTSVVVWSTQATPERVLLEEHGRPRMDASFRDGANDSTITLFEQRTREPVARFKTTVRPHSAFAASPDRRCCAIADNYYRRKKEGDIHLFHVDTGDQARILYGHKAAVSSLEFDPDGRRLLSASDDGTVRLWDVSEGHEINVLRVPGAEPGPWGGCRKAVFAGNARWIVASSAKTITYWPTDGNQIYRTMEHSGGTSWACSRDGLMLAAYRRSPPGDVQADLDIWNVDKKEILQTIRVAYGLGDITFTLDGRRLLGGRAIWSVESGEDIFPLRFSDAARIERLERDWRAKLDPAADGNGATVTWNDGGERAEISVRPGTGKAQVEKDGTTASGDEVSVSQGDRQLVKAAMEKSSQPAAATSGPAEPEKPKPFAAFGCETPGNRENWATDGDELVCRPAWPGAKILFGDSTWTDYDLHFDAKIVNGWLLRVYFRYQDETNFHSYNIGGWNNTWQIVDMMEDGTWGKRQCERPLELAKDTWYQIRIRVRGQTGRCFLNGDSVDEVKMPHLTHGRVGLLVENGASFRFRKIVVKSPDGKVLLEGLPDIARAVRTRFSPREPSQGQ